MLKLYVCCGGGSYNFLCLYFILCTESPWLTAVTLYWTTIIVMSSHEVYSWKGLKLKTRQFTNEFPYLWLEGDGCSLIFAVYGNARRSPKNFTTDVMVKIDMNLLNWSEHIATKRDSCSWPHLIVMVWVGIYFINILMLQGHDLELSPWQNSGTVSFHMVQSLLKTHMLNT